MRAMHVPLLAAALTLGGGCGSDSGRRIVVYVSLDKHLSEPILKRFEAATNVKIDVLYDSEANKTVGLVSRIIAEKANPRCDVFWNNEILQTVRLKKRGLTQPYVPRGAEDIPAEFRDADGHWTGFAARARVLIVNTNLVPAARMPTSVADLADPAWKGKTCIARPLFGTTATHAAALFALDGEDKARAFFQRLLDNDVAILLGNATVRDRVAAGQFAFGLTDTDDVYGAIDRGQPVRMVIPDQGPGGRGTFVIPNTVALIKGAPHAHNARKLIDFLTSATVEQALAEAAGRQIPLRPGVPVPKGVKNLDNIDAIEVDYGKVAEAYPASLRWIQDHFTR